MPVTCISYATMRVKHIDEVRDAPSAHPALLPQKGKLRTRVALLWFLRVPRVIKLAVWWLNTH
jgi:hypothetical protein